MRRSLLLPAAALAGALVLGCSDRPGPAEPAGSPQPSFRTDRHPDGPGAQVMRFGLDLFAAGPDPATGLTLTVGLVSPLADYPFPPEVGCGGTGPVVTDGRRVLQLVFTPNEFVHYQERIQKATIVLYQSTSPNVCDWITAPVFARGAANLTFKIFARDATGQPTVLGLKFQAIVDLTSGGRAHLLNTAQVHIDPDGTARVHVDRFVLKPIGG